MLDEINIDRVHSMAARRAAAPRRYLAKLPDPLVPRRLGERPASLIRLPPNSAASIFLSTTLRIRQASKNCPTSEEWELTFRVNVHAMFYLTKAAVPLMSRGGSIINTASINSDAPNPTLLAYATTKGAIQNFTAGLAQMLAEKSITVNCVAPGPIWTPLIPSTLPSDAVSNFGSHVPMKRPGQPAELATAFVVLADPRSSYVSGATIAVTGGKPIL